MHVWFLWFFGFNFLLIYCKDNDRVIVTSKLFTLSFLLFATLGFNGSSVNDWERYSNSNGVDMSSVSSNFPNHLFFILFIMHSLVLEWLNDCLNFL